MYDILRQSIDAMGNTHDAQLPRKISSVFLLEFNVSWFSPFDDWQNELSPGFILVIW